MSEDRRKVTFFGILLEMDVLLLWVTAMEGSEEYVRGEEDEEVVELDVFLAIKNRTRQTERWLVLVSFCKFFFHFGWHSEG